MINNITQLSPAHGFSYNEPTFIDQEGSDFPEITYMDCQELLDSDFQLDCFADGFIEKCSINLLTGIGGDGKSAIALNMALTLASDACPDLFGFNKPKKELKVAIIQCENPWPSLKDRIDKICKIDPKLRKGLKNVKFIGFNGKIDHPDVKFNNEFFRHLVNEIKKDFNPDILIIDPYICYSDVGENDNAKNSEVFRNLQELLEPLDITAIVVHHQGKAYERNGNNKSRGASSITDRIFNHWAIKRNDKKKELTLVREKSRNFETGIKLKFSIEDGVYFSLQDDLYNPMKVVDILKANNGKFIGQVDLKAEIKRQSDGKISITKAQEMIDAAIEKGAIVKKVLKKNKFEFSLPSS